MAELIRKDKLIDWTYRVPKYYDSMNDRTDMRDFINELPTTTEAEIRASAISDFLQFVYDNASNEEYANEDGWAFSDLMDLEYKFLEQLKEE